MPFTPKEAQEAVEKNNGFAITVGDLCREEYKTLIRAWRKSSRWTTAHNQLKATFGFTDGQTAKILAYLEFYIRNVHPYETEKLKENGDVE